MNEWIDNRQSGETARLIKEASETNKVIVCPSRDMAEDVFQTAQELGYSILMPITYDELFVYLERAKKSKHYFDDILNGFKVLDMSGRELRFKIEVL